MKAENHSCLRCADTTPEENNSGGSLTIDTTTTQVFHQLRLNAEGLALELAVRLRVLGKSLAAACPEAVDGKKERDAFAYTNLRRQLDGFFGSLADGEFAGDQSLPVVREYIQVTLPLELNGCGGDEGCRIEIVDTVISILTEGNYGKSASPGAALSCLSFKQV